MPVFADCPDCHKRLQVPEELLGQRVQCPDCKQTFRVGAEGELTVPQGIAPRPPALLEEPTRPRRTQYDDDRDDDRDDDDEEDDLLLRRSRRRQQVPHRGVMIMIFGVAAIFCILPFVFGPLAWIMGNGDLHAMREGQMDSEGEAMTQTGRVLGIIAVVMQIVLLVGICLFWAFFVLLLGVGLGGR